MYVYSKFDLFFVFLNFHSTLVKRKYIYLFLAISLARELPSFYVSRVLLCWKKIKPFFNLRWTEEMKLKRKLFKMISYKFHVIKNISSINGYGAVGRIKFLELQQWKCNFMISSFKFPLTISNLISLPFIFLLFSLIFYFVFMDEIL